MIRTLSIFLLLPLFLLADSFGRVTLSGRVNWTPVVVTNAVLIVEGFEEVDGGGTMGTGTDGYDSSYANTETGTITNDFTVSPAPLVGTYSLVCNSQDGSSRSVRWNLPHPATNLYARVRFNNTSLPAANAGSVMTFFDDSNAVCADVRLNNGANAYVRVYNGTALNSTVSTVSASTTYYLWLHCIPASGYAEASFSTTSTRPVANSTYYTNVTSTVTANPTRVLLRSDGNLADEIIFDELLVSTNGWPGE